MKRKKIILVDDHILIRTALKELIEKIGDYNVVLEFDNGKSFMEQISTVPECDLIMLDISMPVMDGMETLVKFKEAKRNIPVLIITDKDDDIQAVRVFKIGARGYLRKNCTALELKDAIVSILSTGYYHNKYFTKSVEDISPLGGSYKSKRETILDSLGERERTFLRLVCHEDEFQYGEIADQMDVSLRTVEKIRESLFQKFDVKSKVGLVLYIFRYELYDLL